MPAADPRAHGADHTPLIGPREYASSQALCRICGDPDFHPHWRQHPAGLPDDPFYLHYMRDEQGTICTTACAGCSLANGLGDLLKRVQDKPEIKAAIDDCMKDRPAMYMVDSGKGITNLHVPSDVIIDASMPAMIRASGQMWNADGKQQDTKTVIPDGSYAGVFAETIDFCKEHGAFDPQTMGTVPNVGLMAQKAEEYGSHDKTFELHAAGTVRVVDADGTVLHSHEVEAGDIWRACQVKDAPIRDWVKLAVSRARATGAPAVFWLNADRAHDAQLIPKVESYLQEHDIDGLEFHIMPPAQAEGMMAASNRPCDSRAEWPSTLSEDGAPSASLDHLKAQRTGREGRRIRPDHDPERHRFALLDQLGGLQRALGRDQVRRSQLVVRAPMRMVTVLRPCGRCPDTDGQGSCDNLGKFHLSSLPENRVQHRRDIRCSTP